VKNRYAHLSILMPVSGQLDRLDSLQVELGEPPCLQGSLCLGEHNLSGCASGVAKLLEELRLPLD
jgi:hypothetical protein